MNWKANADEFNVISFLLDHLERRCIDSSKKLEKLLFNVKHRQLENELVLKDLKISVVTYFYKMAAKKKK